MPYNSKYIAIPWIYGLPLEIIDVNNPVDVATLILIVDD
jgi:hypothetical protein